MFQCSRALRERAHAKPHAKTRRNLSAQYMLRRQSTRRRSSSGERLRPPQAGDGFHDVARDQSCPRPAILYSAPTQAFRFHSAPSRSGRGSWQISACCTARCRQFQTHLYKPKTPSNCLCHAPQFLPTWPPWWRRIWSRPCEMKSRTRISPRRLTSTNQTLQADHRRATGNTFQSAWWLRQPARRDLRFRKCPWRTRP